MRFAQNLPKSWRGGGGDNSIPCCIRFTAGEWRLWTITWDPPGFSQYSCSRPRVNLVWFEMVSHPPPPLRQCHWFHSYYFQFISKAYSFQDVSQPGGLFIHNIYWRFNPALQFSPKDYECNIFYLYSIIIYTEPKAKPSPSPISKVVLEWVKLNLHYVSYWSWRLPTNK